MSDEDNFEKDLEKDYNFARNNYYDLAEKGNEAIEIMMNFARDSESPRAMEVLSNMLKQNAEITDRLLELQKNTNALKGQDKEQPKTLTQNNVYVGSTAELQKLIRNQNKIINDDNNNND